MATRINSSKIYVELTISLDRFRTIKARVDNDGVWSIRSIQPQDSLTADGKDRWIKRILPDASELGRLTGQFYFPNEACRIAERARNYLSEAGYGVKIVTYSLPDSPATTRDGRPIIY